MDESSVVRKFMDIDMQLTKGALEVLRSHENMEAAVQKVLLALTERETKPFVITPDIVTEILGGEVHEPERSARPRPSSPVTEAESTRKLEDEAKTKPLPELSHTKFKPIAAEYESRVKILRDVTGKSYSEGELKDFVGLFKDRFEKMKRILRNRIELQDSIPMGSLSKLGERQIVKVIGMVSDKRESSSGNVMIDLEDPTGRATAFVFKKRGELFQKASEVVTDEVIGVVGSLRAGDRIPRIFVNDIIWPDLPVKHELHRAEDPVCAALISDLHVGSEMFLEDLFLKFVRWLRGDTGNGKQRELAGRVKYIVLAGDVVDGIGVYPRQEEELLIDDIFKQYEVAATILGQIPEHITLVILPGNHDAVRPSEPQPAISKDVAEGLYDLNTVMVGNPAWLSLHGVNFIAYHGRSFDDLIGTMPGLNRQNPVAPMVKLLQKRHLAPIYGGRAALSPEQHDYMVIDEIPDVFHCGHVHVNGYTRYRDVSVINSGTFQGKTHYMQQLGVEPTPGMVPVLDLKTHQTRVIRFA
ncbi:MAG: DNA-directed DNA polymerase II small subunit [Hadesarchaea archaeon]|nr:MAG: DNA-directed DNA polymerase II small subunit [Hadesarchaea archaeon]